MHYLYKLPTQLLLSIVAAFLLGLQLDPFYVSLFYTISACFIQILIFLLPIMVFSFIFRALINSKSDSLYLLLLIFVGVTLSNCAALTLAYFFGIHFLPLVGLSHSPDLISKFNSDISILYSLPLPRLAGTDATMIIGIIAGVFASSLKNDNRIKIIAQKFSKHLNQVIILFLQKIFMPLLPLYVFGFCLKLSYDQALIHLFEQFGKVFLLSAFLVAAYIYLMYFFGSGRNFKQTTVNLKTMLPAGLTGFSTMSSAATLPVTLLCTEKTTKDKNFTEIIIPSTANIHMLGDDLNIVIFSLTILSLFGVPWPTLTAWLPFILAFSLAKLSCVGVPGASLLVILPVLQNHLGFTPEMISIMTTIYILQDCFGAAANVMGNGAFALIIQRIFYKTATCPKNSGALCGEV